MNRVIVVPIEKLKRLKKMLTKIKLIKHKFGAVRCERDGKKFPSKLESACFDILKSMQQKKEILFFLRQIPFDLPGNHIHRIDYCVFTEENVIFIEAKGRDLPQGKMKREQVEDIFGINIFLVGNANKIYDVVQVNR